MQVHCVSLELQRLSVHKDKGSEKERDSERFNSGTALRLLYTYTGSINEYLETFKNQIEL